MNFPALTPIQWMFVSLAFLVAINILFLIVNSVRWLQVKKFITEIVNFNTYITEAAQKVTGDLDRISEKLPALDTSDVIKNVRINTQTLIKQVDTANKNLQEVKTRLTWDKKRDKKILKNTKKVTVASKPKKSRRK